MSVAQTIVSQMGGSGRLVAMVGARDFMNHGNGVSFKFKGSKIANYIRVTLDPSDTYNVEFGKIWGARYKVVKTCDMIYCDQLKGLFESTTKLYLSL